jgi:hypothetical protein
MFVGWILAEHANSDTILGGFKEAAVTWGLPREITIDNGRDYRATNPRRRKWDEFDDGRLGNVWLHLGLTVHRALPFQPWAKPIESLFRVLKEFDRLWPSFRGGSALERPADSERIKANPELAPTLDELREYLALYLATYHSSPRTGRGTDGLTPSLIMERSQAERRQIDAATLDLLCCRLDGPRVLRRDGIDYQGLRFRVLDERVALQWQGRELWLRIDPEFADTLYLSDKTGRLLALAVAERIAGTTTEDRRRHHAAQARFKRLANAYLRDIRKFSLPLPDQILAVRAEQAQGREAEQRARMTGTDGPRPVRLVRPDLRADARRIAGQRAGLTGRPARQVPLDDWDEADPGPGPAQFELSHEPLLDPLDAEPSPVWDDEPGPVDPLDGWPDLCDEGRCGQSEGGAA